MLVLGLVDYIFAIFNILRCCLLGQNCLKSSLYKLISYQLKVKILMFWWIINAPLRRIITGVLDWLEIVCETRLVPWSQKSLDFICMRRRSATETSDDFLWAVLSEAPAPSARVLVKTADANQDWQVTSSSHWPVDSRRSWHGMQDRARAEKCQMTVRIAFLVAHRLSFEQRTGGSPSVCRVITTQYVRLCRF